MNYGLQISASGALTAVYRQEALANNLANLETVGFKPDRVSTMHRDPVRDEDGVHHLPSNELIERLGAGSLMAPNRVAFEQGALEDTGNPFDLAIRGEGFFVVRDQSDGSSDRLRLTRDGRFTLNHDGTLVTASGGLPVLDEKNSPITLAEDGLVRVDADGTIRQNDQAVARLQLLDVPDRRELIKQGDATFIPSADALRRSTEATGRVEQGHVEGAAVNEIDALMDVTNAARSVSGNLGMIQYHDRLMQLAISTFGRVA